MFLVVINTDLPTLFLATIELYCRVGFFFPVKTTKRPALTVYPLNLFSALLERKSCQRVDCGERANSPKKRTRVLTRRPRCGGCGTSLTGRRGRQFCRRAPRPEIPGGGGPSTGARGEWGNPSLAFPPFSLSFPSVFSSCLFGIKVNLSFSFVAQHLLPPSVFGDLPDLWSPANTCLRAGRGLLSGRPLGAGEVPWLRTQQQRRLLAYTPGLWAKEVSDSKIST